MQVGWAKFTILDQYLASLHVVNHATTKRYTHSCTGKLVTLIAGSKKRHRLLFTGDGRRSVYDKKPQCYAKDNIIEFNFMYW